MNANLLKKCLKNAVMRGHSILIESEPGQGKSAIVEDLAKEMLVDLAIFHPAVEERTDVKGFPWCSNIDGKVSAEFVTYGEMERLLNPKRRMIAFIDDLGHADEDMQAAWMQPLHARQLNDKPISPNVCFIGATNNLTHKANVKGFIEPLKSRWNSIVHYSPSVDDWVEWAYKNKMPGMLIDFIRFKNEMLNKFVPSKDLTQSPCPRTVASFGKLLVADYPKEAMFELGAGCVGEGFVVEYFSYEKVHGRVPKIADILRDPENADVPDQSEPAILYALCGSLARAGEEKNLASIIKYIERIPKEFEILCMRDLSTIFSKVRKHKLYVDWMLANKDIFLVGAE